MTKQSPSYQNLPSLPGVYIYRNSDNEIIYVGKAINLKKRVTQYFQRDDALGPKTHELVKNIHKIDYKIVGSEIEALVLESSLIKKHKPKYNSQLKDNKSYLYININKNYIETTRQTGTFGPFPNGSQVKYLLKILRRNFPFFTKATHKKTCLYCHIGLCPKDEKENKKNINIIKKILSGKTKTLQKSLELKLKKISKNQNYEEAIIIRDNLYALKYITEGWQNITSLTTNINIRQDRQNIAIGELCSILHIPQINRIECYDISQLGHKYFVGAMSVFQNDKIDNSQYRKFRINNSVAPLSRGAVRRTEGFKPNDPLMLREILTRRLRHREWTYPDLIVLDGGLPQLSIISNVETRNCASLHKIKFIGLIKNSETIVTNVETHHDASLPKYTQINLPKHSLALQLLQQLRDEAHRFANSYRKYLVKNDFVPLLSKRETRR